MMGIRPNRDGLIPPVVPDNPETRYSDWLTDLEESGEIIGGVWKETDAKASSANDGVTDLAGRVAAMEATESANGDGWQAFKRGGVVTVVFDGLSDFFQLPAEFRPPVILYTALAAADGRYGRIRIRPDGLVTREGDTSGSFRGVATYLTI